MENKKPNGLNIDELASLSMLSFNANETEIIENELLSIIEFADKVSSFNNKTEMLEPQVKNVFRDDTVQENNISNEILSGAKTKSERYITVPRTVKE